MPFLKRLSSSFFYLLSPKASSADSNTNETQTPALSLSHNPSIKEESMSPLSSVDGWRMAAPINDPAHFRHDESVKSARLYDSVVEPDAVMDAVNSMDLNDNLDEQDYNDTEADTDYDSDVGTDASNDDQVDHDATTPDEQIIFANVEGNEDSKTALSNVSDIDGLDPAVMTAQDWPQGTVTVLEHIHLRGREALIPNTWSWDFRFLPDILFTPPDADDTAFISATSPDKDAHAAKALSDLFAMAPRARDRARLGLSAEQTVAQHIDRYIEWAVSDAGLGRTKKQIRRLPRLIATCAASRSDTGPELEARMRARFGRLEKRWSGKVGSGRQLPIFYGFMISHTVAALLCYEPDNSQPSPWRDRQIGRGRMRSLVIFDLGTRGYDVWNAFTVAIVIVHVRDEMLRMAEQGMFTVETGVEMDDDPDA